MDHIPKKCTAPTGGRSRKFCSQRFYEFFIGLVFSIYVLANKEKLKRQTLRLIRVWLPQRFDPALVHVITVCNRSFRNFIAGQATEAVILGMLCTIGMLILRLPYAPMIGTLGGVTALIPIVGAFVGHSSF